MAKLETALSEPMPEGMRQLTDQEKKALAATVLSDPKLEAFVKELDDNLTGIPRVLELLNGNSEMTES